MGRKNGSGKTALWIVAVVAIAGLAVFGTKSGWFDGVGSQAGAISTGSDGQQVLNTCGGDVTPVLDYNCYDSENPGTALTEGNLWRKVGGTAWTAVSCGTATGTLEVGKQYEVVFGISTTDQTDNMYGKYLVTDPVACKEVTELDFPVFNDDPESGLTATFYNADDAAATAEVFTAGQVQTIGMKWVSTNDAVFGNPFIAESSLADNGNHRKAYPNIVCLDLNSTAWDAPQKVTYQGVSMNRVSTPLRHSAVASEIAYCYEAPVIKETMDKMFVTLDADDSNAPVNDDTALLYAANFYIDAKTGNVAWGVEDEDGNVAGTDAADTLTLDFS